MPKRLSHAERREHTRACLLEAAVRVFLRRGLQQASIDELTEEAGYTKGAFYANFKSKEELFLAMLDERFAARLAEIERVLESDQELEEQTRQAGEDFTSSLRADAEWERLFLEFSAYAARNAEFREELVTRYGALREAMGQRFRRFAERHDLSPSVSADEVALMTFAMANGFAIEKLLEPDIPDEVYSKLLLIFFTGLRTLAATAEPAAEADRTAAAS